MSAESLAPDFVEQPPLRPLAARLDQAFFSVIEGVTVLLLVAEIFILFAGIDDFEDYLEGAEAMERGESSAMPPHFSLNFDRGTALSAALRKEIAEHRWEVAGAAAYPWLMAIDEDLVGRPPTAEEVTIAEALALALPRVLAEKKALLSAWKGGEPVSRTLSVRTHVGDIAVTLRVPCDMEPSESKPAHGLLAELFELEQEGEDLDAEARRPLEAELLRRFVASPEAKALPGAHFCHFVLDYAADYFGATIATLDATELQEIVFEIIPRQVSIAASEAAAIIETNRAFYAFLKRECALPQADACLRVLAGDAVKELETALSDSSQFGMAKSLFMAGREAGFAMDTQEGVEAWMRIMQSRPLPESIRLPSVGVPGRPAGKKKNQRKAAKKARKKNR